MEWNKILTDKQLKRLNAIKNPTVTKILQLSEELNMDIKVIFTFYADRHEKSNLYKK